MDETWQTDTIAPQDDDSEVPVKLTWNHNLAVITWNMQTPVGEEPQSPAGRDPTIPQSLILTSLIILPLTLLCRVWQILPF